MCLQGQQCPLDRRDARDALAHSEAQALLATAVGVSAPAAKVPLPSTARHLRRVGERQQMRRLRVCATILH